MIKKIVILLLFTGVITSCNSSFENGKSKLEKQIDQTTSPGIILTATPDKSISPLIIEKVERIENSELITLANISDEDIDLKNYIIVDPQDYNLKKFPQDTILKPGEKYLILNGDGQTKISETFDYWLPKNILKQANDEIIITNEAGRIIWSFIYLH